MMMQLAERGTYFGHYDIFKERAKFATSDAYEDHFNLPKNRSLIITHRRVLLLQVAESCLGCQVLCSSDVH
jgi:vacuolar protein sorting-associated protein 13A/C